MIVTVAPINRNTYVMYHTLLLHAVLTEKILQNDLILPT